MCCLCCSSDEAGRGLGKAEGGSNLETKMRKGQEAGRGSGRPGDRDPVLWRVDGEQPFSLTSLFLSRIFCPWGKLPMEKFCSITRIGEDLLKEEGKEEGKEAVALHQS